MRFLALSLAALLAFPAASGQPVVFVDASASGAGDGASWETAYPELGLALDAAPDGAQLWVARGVYRPTDGTDRTATFALRSGVEVLGGFVGTETSVDDRVTDPATNGTVLSCDIGTTGTPTDNCYHVVSAVGADATAVLDGFLVTGGRADGDAPHDRGGGLTNFDGGSDAPDTEGFPTLRNLRFEANTAVLGGGAYFNEAADPVRLLSVAFEDNTASVWGGGVLSSADLEMEAVSFIGNEATERGGGAFFDGTAAVAVRGAAFRANRVGDDVTSGRGAGLNVVASAAVTLLDVSFVRNVATFDNAGDGGGFNIAESATVHLVNATFLGNVARTGAGFFTRGDSRVTATNAVFAGNRSQDDEAGSVVTVTAASSATLADVTLAGNRANAVLASNSVDEAEILNGIVWGNSDLSILTLGGSTVRVDHAIIEGGAAGEAVLTTDPLFHAAPDPGPDGEWGTDDDDYGDLHLRPESPAESFGDLELLPNDVLDVDGDGVTVEVLPLDLDGEARVQDDGVELGAYEGLDPPVDAAPGAASARLELGAIRPNPAQGALAVPLTLGVGGPVEVALYDVRGRRVAVLYDGPAAAGEHTLGIDASGLPAGVYVLRVMAPTGTAMRRLTVVR